MTALDKTAGKTASKVLYRKYRPTKLEDVVGQEQVTKLLENAIAKNNIGHAYLFIGPRGTGKTSVARIFAHAVNGFDYQIEDSYLDIIEIDAASNTGVDNIRDLREKAIIAPTKGKYKVYIIDEVHMLTRSASNALLKTLEEPPEHVIFIMATTDAHKVPITISSRTEVHTFRLADQGTMFKHLRQISDAENINIDDDALKLIVKHGGGSFRDSLSLLDQISKLSQHITAKSLELALGLPKNDIIEQLLQAYIERDSATINQTLKTLLNNGTKPELIASELISQIIDMPRSETLPLLEKLPEVQPPFPEAKLLLALLEFEIATNPASVLTKPGQISNIPNGVDSSKQSEQQLEQKPASKIPDKRPETETEAEPKINPKAKTETDPKPKANPKPSSKNPANFSWENFVETIHDKSDAIYNQLKKVEHEFDGRTLHLYPLQKFAKSILERKGNNQILADALPDIELVIHELGETSGPEDKTISQVSAIMGGVQEVNGDMPF